MSNEPTQEQRRNRLLLEQITQAQSQLVEGNDSRAVFGGLLQALLALTESEYGFIGEILSDGEGAYLKTHAISDISWNEETRIFYKENAPRGLEFRSLDTLFGYTIRSGEAVLTNSPSKHPESKGIPKGHPPLKSYLGLPFHFRGELIGMIGIANRHGGYQPEQINFLKPFLYTCANIIVSLRNEISRAEAFKRLQENELRSRAILNHTIDAIVTIDGSGIIESCNPAATKLFGYARRELIGQNVSILMPDPHRSIHDSYIQTYLKTGQAHVIGRNRELPGRHKSGRIFQLELAVSEIRFEERRIFMGVLRDISQRKSGEAELTLLNTKMSQQVGQLKTLAADNTLLAELGSYLQASHSEKEIYQLVQRYLSLAFKEDQGGLFVISSDGEVEQVARIGDDAGVEPILDRWDCWALRRGEVHLSDERERRIRCPHLRASERSAFICAPVLTQDGLAGLISLSWRSAGQTKRHINLLTALADRTGASLSNMRLRRRLKEESIRDPLTRLYNRRYMHEYLRRQLRRASSLEQQLAVLMFDIDHFKRFNDDYGHDIGDLALKSVAQLLTDRAKHVGIACRLGGEEFLLILPNTSKAKAIQQAEMLRSEFSELEIKVRHLKIPSITTSVGVAIFPEHADREFDLLQRADLALYQAKNEGRDRVCVFGENAINTNED